MHSALWVLLPGVAVVALIALPVWMRYHWPRYSAARKFAIGSMQVGIGTVLDWGQDRIFIPQRLAVFTWIPNSVEIKSRQWWIIDSSNETLFLIFDEYEAGKELQVAKLGPQLTAPQIPGKETYTLVGIDYTLLFQGTATRTCQERKGSPYTSTLEYYLYRGHNGRWLIFTKVPHEKDDGAWMVQPGEHLALGYPQVY